MTPDNLTMLLARGRSLEPTILSAYLHVEPAESADLDRGYAVTLNRLATSLRKSFGRGENVGLFDAAMRRLEAYVKDCAPIAGTVVLFYDAADDFFWHGDISGAVANQMRWNHELLLQPLLNALDEQEPYGVVLADPSNVRMFIVSLGKIAAVVREKRDMKRVRRLKSAGHDHLGSSNVLQRKADERIRTNLRQVITEMAALATSRNVHRFILAGTREITAALRKLLPAGLAPAVIGEAVLAMNASPARVHAVTGKIAAEYERKTEMKKVDDVITASAKGGGAVIGLEDALRAVNSDSVFELIYAEGFESQGYECQKCSALFLARLTRCLFCAARTQPVDDVVARAAERAAQNQARIEVVAGKAAVMLKKAGSISAFLKTHAVGRPLRPSRSVAVRRASGAAWPRISTPNRVI